MDRKFERIALTVAASFVVVYSVAVVWFVATSPDLGLRCLLIEETQPGNPNGVALSAAPDSTDIRVPNPGDTLLAINEKPTRSFFDFCNRLWELREAKVEVGGNLLAGDDPSEDSRNVALVKGHLPNPELRQVKIEFRKAGDDEKQSPYINVEHLPAQEILLTLSWFFIQLVILILGGVSLWNRPLDRSLQIFFAMCIVTLGAFVGGFHWWIIAGSPILNIPFITCAALVPAVTLHFFLGFPRRSRFLTNSPILAPAMIYVPAIISICALSSIYLATWSMNGTSVSDRRIQDVAELLSLLRNTIVVCIAVAAVYFTITIVVLVHGFLTTRNPIERSQVKWIVWAGLFATIPFAYTIHLALNDRVGFVLGKGRIPMFIASLSFMLAYSFSILPQRLAFGDAVVARGRLYYAVSVALMVACAFAIGAAGLLPHKLNLSLTIVQRMAVFCIVVASVMLLMWLRDRTQQIIDRRFFQEKYGIDKALQRIRQAARQTVDPDSLATMMLGTCDDVLQSERIGMYFRNPQDGIYRLMAVRNASDMPLELHNQELIEALNEGGALQRIRSASRETMSPVQTAIHDLDAMLLYPLESESNPIGLVVLGKKRNGLSYTAEDLTFLHAMSQVTAVALHSARANQNMTRLNEELQHKVERIAAQRRQIDTLQAELASVQSSTEQKLVVSNQPEFKRDSIKGNSPAIQRVLQTVSKVAGTESSILIRGESGTGKELLARVLHDNSTRAKGPIVSVHCASLSPFLLESELFGHVKGAFTGAESNKIGRFEAANGGTLFLDEIGDINLETQIKLLRVLQERCFEPVGGSKTIHADVRLVTATHQNLEKLISEGAFREDLYYRLNVISLTLPSLRERPEDMIGLSVHFLMRAAAQTGKPVNRFDDEALAALEKYSWPGNIRELENVIERAVVLAEDDCITINDLPVHIVEEAQGFSLIVEPNHVAVDGTQPRRITTSRPAAQRSQSRADKNRAERELLVATLNQCNGNKAEAARTLGMPRSTLYSKVKKYNIV